MYLDNCITRVRISEDSEFNLVKHIQSKSNYIGYFRLYKSLFEKSLINKYIKEWMQR